jgi:hypothetical protein
MVERIEEDNSVQINDKVVDHKRERSEEDVDINEKGIKVEKNVLNESKTNKIKHKKYENKDKKELKIKEMKDFGVSVEIPMIKVALKEIETQVDFTKITISSIPTSIPIKTIFTQTFNPHSFTHSTQTSPSTHRQQKDASTLTLPSSPKTSLFKKLHRQFPPTHGGSLLTTLTQPKEVVEEEYTHEHPFSVTLKQRFDVGRSIDAKRSHAGKDSKKDKNHKGIFEINSYRRSF